MCSIHYYSLGTVIILALSFLAQYFYFIPKAALAAVLISAASSLIDYEIFPVLWKCNSKIIIIKLFSLFALTCIFRTRFFPNIRNIYYWNHKRCGNSHYHWCYIQFSSTFENMVEAKSPD